MVTWLLVLAMPFHALTAVYLDLRGPAHFHVHHEHDDDGGDHDHGRLERHYHPALDPSVVTTEDDATLDGHALAEGVSPGWSALCLALVSAAPSWHQPRASGGIVPGSESRLLTRSLGRLERPPR